MFKLLGDRDQDGEAMSKGKVASMADHSGDSFRWSAEDCLNAAIEDIREGKLGKIEKMMVIGMEEEEDGRSRPFHYNFRLTNETAVSLHYLFLHSTVELWREG